MESGETFSGPGPQGPFMSNPIYWNFNGPGRWVGPMTLHPVGQRLRGPKNGTPRRIWLCPMAFEGSFCREEAGSAQRRVICPNLAIQAVTR